MISDLSVETDKSSPNLEKNSPGQVLDYLAITNSRLGHCELHQSPISYEARTSLLVTVYLCQVGILNAMTDLY